MIRSGLPTFKFGQGHMGPVFGLALSVLGLTGCATMAPETGVAVSAGAQSDQWLVRWDPALRVPTIMTNRSLQDQTASHRDAAISDSAAEAAARTVFRERAEWFRLRAGRDDFSLYRSYTRGWLRTLKFVQTYEGLPVMGKGYEVTVFPTGRVGSIEGAFWPDLQTDVRPTLTAQQAEDFARSYYGAGAGQPSDAAPLYFENEPGFDGPSFLALVPQGERFALAWGVVVMSTPRSYARVYVDANHATILGSQSLGNREPR